MPDTESDAIYLGTNQAKKLSELPSFKDALRLVIEELGGIKELKRIVVGGQSLGGGIASIFGLYLVNGSPDSTDQAFYEKLKIPAEKLFSASVNGFTKEEVSLFNQQADEHRIVVKNLKTSEFGLVSQLGG